MFALRGLATGIGSFPHKDAGEALDLIFKYCPQLPFWPQLPKRDMREGMVAQFSEGFPCIKVTEAGVVFNDSGREKELERFYEKAEIEKDIGYFAITPDFAQGLYAFKERLKKTDLKPVKEIKCHIVGPFTFAASFKDKEGKALLHDAEMLQAITEGLIMKALWQIDFLKEFGKDFVIFIDEPYLGCFGSAYTPLNRKDAVEVLKGLTGRISNSAMVRMGVHCCGNTDWSIFTDIPQLDIINFDAFGFLDKFALYPKELNDFLKRGGIICWGIIPTSGHICADSAEGLSERLKQGIDALAGKGVDRELLAERLLVSPSCGMGSLDEESTLEILELLSRVSAKVRAGV